MTSISTTPRDQRVNTVFLRSIGAMTLGAHELASLRTGVTPPEADSWGHFADQLQHAADAVLEAACGSSFPGNTIAIIRDGVRVPVGVDHLDRLTEKIHRHVRVGLALGFRKPDPAERALSMSA